jgi:hypothetical protein
MRYLVYFEIPTEEGNRLDFEEAGPGPILGYVMDRFKPEASYTQAGMRAVFMVADLNEAQMTELMLIVSKKFGTYPEFTPVVPGAATPGIAAKAIEEAKKAP